MAAAATRNRIDTKRLKRPWLRTLLVLLILLIGGVVAGTQLGRKIDVFAALGLATPPVPENPTRLRVGEQLNLEDVVAGAGESSARLDALAQDHKILLCFVTNGCDPCRQYVDLLASEPVLPDETYRIVLLSTTPEVFESYGDLTILPVAESFLEANGIHQYPITVGVDARGRIALIVPGFMPDLFAGYISQHL